jgi:hypothetical protein
MPSAADPPDYRQTLNDSVVETANALITRSVGVVEASHRFMELAAELDVLDDEDFSYFVALDSQSDGFPVGAAREHWSAKALEREDGARKEYEDSVYEEAAAHCRSLISKYTAAP